ncbi:MAG: DUF2029 domain-containing protein [Oscillospiraceae bacterium]|nr:DUF2029 domain-containing protein [Oscillospiraceae bacterium]
MDIRVTLLILIEALFAAYLLWRSGCVRTAVQWSVVATLLLVAFVPRLLALKYETKDYLDFLARWVDFYRQNGGFRAIGKPVGNYNIPYLYFLALFSYSRIKDLYLIKLLSIFFDVLLAWGGMRIVSRLTDKPLRRVGVFFTLLLLPTVYLNGSVWGQCDSIFVALAVLALADAMEDHPVRAMVMLALSFGFKLQAVFVMPVFALLLFAGKIKWKHLPVFPLTYVILVLPAVIAGRPFKDTIMLYFNQTGSVGSSLNYNSSSIFGIFRHVQNPEAAATAAIVAAFLFMLLVIAVCGMHYERLNDRTILIAAVLLAIGIPFLLPHMHDRYFFAADALSVILVFSLPLLAPVAALTQFASLLGYYAYLVMKFLLYMDRGSWALIAALIVLGVSLACELRGAPVSGQHAAKGKEPEDREMTGAEENVLDNQQ